MIERSFLCLKRVVKKAVEWAARVGAVVGLAKKAEYPSTVTQTADAVCGPIIHGTGPREAPPIRHDRSKPPGNQWKEVR